MLVEARHFKEESDDLFGLLASLPEQAYDIPTQFKGWTLNDVLQHLHFFNVLADLSLADERAFSDRYAIMMKKRNAGESIVSVTDEMLDGLKYHALRDQWQGYYRSMADRWEQADPQRRVKWAGPSMSVRSSISARLMETWAHAQEVFDLLGVERGCTDRIKSIAVLGINTFGWTFANRNETVPDVRPYVSLTAPSGSVWAWGEPSEEECIRGSAEAFCQVVTQVRNVADTGLEVIGQIASEWMSKAQCFAGVPRNPPAPGTRFLNEKGALAKEIDR